ncbi:MAG: type II toxin-antitoxin system VapC family toxin [Candidatus Njordarchaeota archaeon]
MEKERKYVDVNVFVYWLVDSEYTAKAKYWIQKIEESAQGEFYTSTMTVYEVAVIIAGLIGESLGNKSFIEKILDAFRSLKQLSFIPLDKKDILKIVEIVRSFGLDMEDALHYIAAKKVGAHIIISNDKDFESTELERIF